jgi:hypothetical protein
MGTLAKKRITRVKTHAWLSIRENVMSTGENTMWKEGNTKKSRELNMLSGLTYEGVLSYEDEAIIIWEGAVLRIRIRIDPFHFAASESAAFCME